MRYFGPPESGSGSDSTEEKAVDQLTEPKRMMATRVEDTLWDPDRRTPKRLDNGGLVPHLLAAVGNTWCTASFKIAGIVCMQRLWRGNERLTFASRHERHDIAYQNHSTTDFRSYDATGMPPNE